MTMTKSDIRGDAERRAGIRNSFPVAILFMKLAYSRIILPLLGKLLLKMGRFIDNVLMKVVLSAPLIVLE